MKIKRTALLGLLLLVPVVAETTLAGKTIYVDADATGEGNGATWADAYNYLQDGLAVALSGDEIHVAQGTYRPDQGVGKMPGDRYATFQVLRNGVVLKGAYAGFGEPEPDARNVDLYETILSGDLNGNDVGNADDPSRSENAYSVVVASWVDDTVVLDGFTIAGGNANGDPAYTYDTGGGMKCDHGNAMVLDCTFRKNHADGNGGGMSVWAGNPTVSGCTFEGNQAGYYGGGAMFGYSSSTLQACVFADNSSKHGGGLANVACDGTIADCTFRGNSATGDGGGMRNDFNGPNVINCTFSHNSCGSSGAGMVNLVSNPTLADCSFESNHAGFFGGGMINGSSSAILTNCIFRQNSGYAGGAMANGGWGGPPSNAVLTNCVFAGNAADTWGGGILNGTDCDATIINCTFSGNNGTSHGAAVSNQGERIVATLANCILWGNSPSAVAGNGLIIHHSDVEGGTGQPWFGIGCIDVDPQFADSAGRLLPDSPCVDAGDNGAVPPDVTTDLDGNPRIQGVAVDMGAYESLKQVTVADFLLHGVAPDLILDNTEPTGTTAKYKDSPSVNRTAYKEVGTWAYTVPSTMSVQSLGDLGVWVGLKNSDDQGTYFDIRAELLKNGTPVAWGETLNIQGVTRNPDSAKEVAVVFGAISDGVFNAGDVLSLRILTKVTATGGHSSAVGLRLYYDSLSRPSGFNASLIR